MNRNCYIVKKNGVQSPFIHNKKYTVHKLLLLLLLLLYFLKNKSWFKKHFQFWFSSQCVHFKVKKKSVRWLLEVKSGIICWWWTALNRNVSHENERTLCWQLCLLNNSGGRPANDYEQPVRRPRLVLTGGTMSQFGSLRMAFKASHMFLVLFVWCRIVNKSLLDRYCWNDIMKTHSYTAERGRGFYFGISVSSLAASPPLPSSWAGDPSKRVIIHDWAG